VDVNTRLLLLLGCSFRLAKGVQSRSHERVTTLAPPCRFCTRLCALALNLGPMHLCHTAWSFSPDHRYSQGSLFLGSRTL
jgi:hypothetical protein